MEFHKLILTEHIKTRALWEKVFPEDTDQFLNYYYQEKTKDNEIYVATDESVMRAMEITDTMRKMPPYEMICSMLQLNPYQMRIGGHSFTGHYIIAVATDPVYRKRGLMRRLLHLSMQDMYRRGEAFTYLMPAAEAIYLPFDFRFVYNQKQGNMIGVKLPESTQLKIRHAKPADCRRMAELAGEFLEDYQVYAKRSEAYYLRMLKEQESENGGFIVILNQKELVGFFAYAYETAFEVREPIFKSGFEQTLPYGIYQLTGNETQAVKLTGYENMMDGNRIPTIMFRILHPEFMFETMRAKDDFIISLRITDHIIEENNRCFELVGKKGHQIKVMNSDKTSKNRISIAALASFVSGYKTPREIAEEEGVCLGPEAVKAMEGIETLSRIFLNEIV